MSKKESIRSDDITCPLCGSEKIILIRGEIHSKDNFQECKCTTCDGDFLISYCVLHK